MSEPESAASERSRSDPRPAGGADPAADPRPRHHVRSRLMRESLLDREVERSTESPVFRMLPEAHVLKIGGRSILDAGREVVYPVVAALAACLERWKLILGTGGGVRTRHVFSIGIDLGLPTGVLAQLAAADALHPARDLRPSAAALRAQRAGSGV